MTWKERHEQWERMGLCTNCGGLRLDLEYRMCAKCRAKERERKRALYAKDMPVDEKPRIMPEIRKNHKCWYCEWRRFEQDRFFCPFVEGTCMKDGNAFVEPVKDEPEKEDEE